MITATYTDPFTGWEQRVTVSGGKLPEPGEVVWIGTSDGVDVAQATADVLTDFRFEQDERREYLPPWSPTADQMEAGR